MDSTRRGAAGRSRGGANQAWIVRAILAIGGVLLAWTSLPAAAQDWSKVPGVAIAYLESPDRWPLLGYPYSWDEAYLGSPSITIMPDGTYIATHDVFGSGTDENTTWVYRSTNKGASWTQLGSISNQFWSTVFQLNGTLYVWGYTNGDNGDIVIRSSHDNGSTWSSAVTLRSGDYGGTPNTPVIYNGRIWIAVGGNRVMSASTSSTLLNSSNWTLSDSASSSTQPFGDDWQSWSEGQVVASPQTGVVVLPKIRGLPNTALIRINSPEDARSPQAEDWVSLPGGEKKFGMQYDAVSGRFYALTNVVLPAHANDDSLRNEPELIRNTGAMLSSKDLINWDVEQIFLYTPNIDTESDKTGWGEAFQYFQFAIDGNDLAVVSRTALDVGDGQNDPPRGHDSNLITFHVIDDFRTATADQYLKIENGTINRYERTQHKTAPLGAFALGSTFDGVALTNPSGLADDEHDYVYIRESSGRILQFDYAGNFISTVSALPSNLSWSTSSRSILAPSRDRRTWVRNGGGDWADPLNWLYWGRPDTNEEIATLGSASDADRTYISVNQDYTVKGFNFLSLKAYRLGNGSTGSFTLEADTGHARITVAHVTDNVFYVPVKLYSDTDTSLAPTSSIYINNSLDLKGHTFNVAGGGYLRFNGTLVMHGGELTTDGLGRITFYEGSNPTLDGDLTFLPDSSLSLTTVGAKFDLLNGQNYLNGQTFNHVNLPALANTLGWDISDLYDVNGYGTVKIVQTYTPEWASNVSGDWVDALNWQYRSRPDSTVEVANFKAVNTTTRYANINAGQTVTVKGLNFDSPNRYIIDGDGALNLDADTGNASITVLQGSHWVRVDSKLFDNLDLSVANGQRFEFRDSINLNGKTLAKTGAGVLDFDQALALNGGRLKTDGLSPLTFSSPSAGQITLNGDFEFAPDSSLALTLGTVFNLTDGTTYLSGQKFAHVYMPQLANLLGWDMSSFYSSAGTASVMQVLSPEWGVDANGDWTDIANWAHYARPDSNQEIVTLGSVITANRTITMNQNYSVKGLHYLPGAGGRYDIYGTGTLTLDADTGHALIDVETGAQRAYVNVKLNDHTNITTYQPSAEFNFYGGLDLNGKLLFVLGTGVTRIRGNFQMNGGRLVLDGQHYLSFASTSTNTLDGTFEFAPASGLSLALGAHYNLIDGLAYFSGQQFTSIVLPELDNLLGWNYDSFYSNGEVDVIAVLSPEWAADANGNWLDSPSWKHRAKPDSNLEVASFKAINTATRYAYINAGQTVTVKGLDFDSPNRYVIDGDGALTLQSGVGNAAINVLQGSPWIRVDTKFSSNVDAALTAGTELSFRDSLNLNGAAFSLTGGGRVTIADHLTMNGGRFVVDGLSKVVFNSTSAGLLNLNGYFQFAPAAGINLAAGSSYDLIDGESYLSGQNFTSLVLPTAPDATGWDTTSFYSDGKVKLVSVPAPNWTKSSSGNWTDAINWQYSCRPDSNLEIATFASAITSAATVTLNSTYAVKGLRFNSANKYTLGGSGAINLDADTGHAVLDVLAGSHEVQVPLKLYDMTDATLAANTSLRLSGSLNLNGQTLNVSGPGTLTFAGPVQCEGATINLQNNSTVAFGSGYLNLTSGTVLSGNGMVNSIVFNSGRVSPGESTGTLWMVGGYGQSASGQLDIEITYAGQHDSVVVLGGASLSGKLKLMRLDGYVPTRGASFTVLTAQSVSGQFATIEGLTVNSNLSLAVTYTGTSVLVTAALPGDANLDGKINLADLQILGDHWNKSTLSWALGDFNGDGKVNLSDLQIVGDHWGGSAADFAALAATIPEPGSVGMALCLMLIAPGRGYRSVR